MDGDAERPALQARGHGEGYNAEPAHADLGELPARFQASGCRGAEVDAPLARLAGADDAAQGSRIGNERVNELSCSRRHARGGADLFLHCFAPCLALVHIT